MIQTQDKAKIVQQALDNHAEQLATEFSTFEEFQDLFIDVFGDHVGSSNNLTNLQNQFANGILRPQVKFVSSDILTDDEGNLRYAAFEQKSQTILLSEDLDAAGIEISIEQELGHWWDVQLNGERDTTTLDGKPFDEGTAYAERFSEGVNGDNIFSDLVYQSDFQTILVDGQETEVEFRPIATWNIQGARNNAGANSTWADVFNFMNDPNLGNPQQNIAPIEIAAIQEAGQNLGTEFSSIPGLTNLSIDNNSFNFVTQYDFSFNGSNWRVYWTRGGTRELDKTQAIVLRNPTADTIAIRIPNPQGEFFRPALGVQLGNNGPYYFSVHASSGNSDAPVNDAESLLQATLDAPQLQDTPRYVLGDFNRNVSISNDPTDLVGNLATVWPNQRRISRK